MLWPWRTSCSSCLVDLGAVWALGFDQPVLGIEEDFAVGLPDAVAAHPLPLVPGVVLGEIDDDLRRLEVHQAALDEDLHGDVGLDDARGHLARGHLHVDEEVVEEAVRIGVDEIAGAIALGGEIGLQGRGPVLADGIHQRGGERQPRVVVGCWALRTPSALAAMLSAVGSSGGTAPQLTICAPVAPAFAGHRLKGAQRVVGGRLRVVRGEGETERGREGLDVRQRPAGDGRQRALRRGLAGQGPGRTPPMTS